MKLARLCVADGGVALGAGDLNIENAGRGGRGVGVCCCCCCCGRWDGRKRGRALLAAAGAGVGEGPGWGVFAVGDEVRASGLGGGEGSSAGGGDEDMTIGRFRGMSGVWKAFGAGRS